MAIHRITVGGKRFFLEPGQDVAALKRHITQAVRQGGAFVRLATAGDSGVDVLITPELPVWLEELDGQRNDAAAAASEAAAGAWAPADVVSEYDDLVPELVPA